MKIAVFKYLKGCYKEEGELLFSLTAELVLMAMILNCSKVDSYSISRKLPICKKSRAKEQDT